MLQENPAIFLRDFGADGTLGGQPVRGLFSGAHSVAPVGGPGMVMAKLSFWLSDALVPDPVVGLQLVLPVQAHARAGTYKVEVALPDGTGFTLLELSEVRA